MNSPAEHYAGVGAGAIRSLVKAMNAIIIVSGCIMALTFFFVVILRYIFNADLFAYEEWLLTIAFWMFFMASAVATYRNTHINADILGILLHDPKKIWLRGLLVTGIELVILVFLTYLGAQMILEDLAKYPRWQTTIALKIPFVVPRMGIFLGLFFMMAFSLLSLIVQIKTGPERVARDTLAPGIGE